MASEAGKRTITLRRARNLVFKCLTREEMIGVDKTLSLLALDTAAVIAVHEAYPDTKVLLADRTGEEDYRMSEDLEDDFGPEIWEIMDGVHADFNWLRNAQGDPVQ